jgi:hypothetical protein
MDFEKEIHQLQQRNRRVETDKAWETSWTRKLSIAALTYLAANIFLLVTESTHPFLSALVPAFGFLLSTLSLPLIKKWWTKELS